MGKLFLAILVPLMFFKVFVSQYVIIQGEHYEYNKYMKYESVKKILLCIFQIILLTLGFVFENIFNCIILITSISVNLLLLNNKKIKITNRIKRIFIIYYIITFLIYYLLPLSAFFSFLIISSLMLEIVFFVHYISCFIEFSIMNYYIKDAKNIIKGKKIIGITGSYGKTSCKNIIYDMLSNFCNVSKTPKSFNTKVGIVKSIREYVGEFDDIFICEYGVDKKRAMNKLIKIIKPNITLITEIGEQHLLTFKNIENIKNEKIKLAKCLKKDEIAVINNDNEHLIKEIKNLKCKVITYGINNNSDIMAKNIKVGNEGSTFDLYIDGRKFNTITIRLLGYHNVMNTLGAIGVLKSLNINLTNIKELVYKIKPVEHRLQLKEINGLKVIDDSFNSNEKGFKFAIDVLCTMKEDKIVITPGVIEQGKNGEIVNYELGQYMSDKVDLVILVEKNSKIIEKGMLSKGFDKKNIIIKSNFLEAWEFVNLNINKENKIILIENDLPSIYLK